MKNSPRPKRGIQLLSLLFCRKALPLGCTLFPSLTLPSLSQSQASAVCRKPISRQTVQHSFLSLFRGPEKAQPGKGRFPRTLTNGRCLGEELTRPYSDRSAHLDRMRDVLPVWIREIHQRSALTSPPNWMLHYLDLLSTGAARGSVLLCVKIGLCNELFGKQQG